MTAIVPVVVIMEASKAYNIPQALAAHLVNEVGPPTRELLAAAGNPDVNVTPQAGAAPEKTAAAT